MALLQLFSRRKRQAQGESLDVYEYDAIPDRLRVQVVQIINDGLGDYATSSIYGNVPSETAHCYDFIVKALRREAATHRLVGHTSDPQHELFRWLETAPEVDVWLDAVELSINVIERVIGTEWHRYRASVTAKPDDLVAELNARFREEGFGYQYVDGEMIRVDAEVAHREMVLPVLHLLRAERFKSADQEYRGAHAAYRHGNFEDSLVGCAKALESVLKVVGTRRGWPIKDTDTASRLVHAAADSGFLPSLHKAALNHLVGLIESSTPTVRNKMGGHGAGAEPRDVPRHLAAYQLHQTAAVILFLAEQDRSAGP